VSRNSENRRAAVAMMGQGPGARDQVPGEGSRSTMLDEILMTGCPPARDRAEMSRVALWDLDRMWPTHGRLGTEVGLIRDGRRGGRITSSGKPGGEPWLGAWPHTNGGAMSSGTKVGGTRALCRRTVGGYRGYAREQADETT